MSEAPKIRILLVDDHPIVRVGLKNLVESQGDMAVVAEAGDGVNAVEAYLTHRPDVTLMDLRMPGVDGAQAIAAIIEKAPEARIMVLTTYDGDEDIYRAVRAGARGYMLKDSFPEGMLDAIREVHAGGHLFSEAVASKLAAREASPSLSPRETNVLEMVARGLSNKEIQTALSMAEGTLKNHLKRVFEKLGVDDRTQAALVAVKRGLIRLP